MYDMRDRLIALIKTPHKADWLRQKGYDIGQYEEDCIEAMLADLLLANGVIVLPCNLGDTMYKICSVNSRIKMGSMWDGNIVKTNCDRCGYRNCYCYDIGLRDKHEFMIDVVEPKVIKSIEFAVKIIPYVGKIWFATQEEAEAAIAEMREEKNK